MIRPGCVKFVQKHERCGRNREPGFLRWFSKDMLHICTYLNLLNQDIWLPCHHFFCVVVVSAETKNIKRKQLLVQTSPCGEVWFEIWLKAHGKIWNHTRRSSSDVCTKIPNFFQCDLDLSEFSLQFRIHSCKQTWKGNFTKSNISNEYENKILALATLTLIR